MPSRASMADTFRLLARSGVIPQPLAERLSHAVSFRTIAVHQYQDISWRIVLSIVTKDLQDFRLFAGHVERLGAQPHP